MPACADCFAAGNGNTVTGGAGGNGGNNNGNNASGGNKSKGNDSGNSGLAAGNNGNGGNGGNAVGGESVNCASPCQTNHVLQTLETSVHCCTTMLGTVQQKVRVLMTCRRQQCEPES